MDGTRKFSHYFHQQESLVYFLDPESLFVDKSLDQPFVVGNSKKVCHEALKYHLLPNCKPDHL